MKKIHSSFKHLPKRFQRHISDHKLQGQGSRVFEYRRLYSTAKIRDSEISFSINACNRENKRHRKSIIRARVSRHERRRRRRRSFDGSNDDVESTRLCWQRFQAFLRALVIQSLTRPENKYVDRNILLSGIYGVSIRCHELFESLFRSAITPCIIFSQRKHIDLGWSSIARYGVYTRRCSKWSSLRR